MNREEFIEQLEQNAEDDIDIVRKKNQDYAGDTDPFKNFELAEFLGVCSTEEAMMVRMADKLQRIANVMDGDNAVEDETVIDTLSDLRNYANIMQVYIDNDT
jgi:hypothetical protein